MLQTPTDSRPSNRRSMIVCQSRSPVNVSFRGVNFEAGLDNSNDNRNSFPGVNEHLAPRFIGTLWMYRWSINIYFRFVSEYLSGTYNKYSANIFPWKQTNLNALKNLPNCLNIIKGSIFGYLDKIVSYRHQIVLIISDFEDESFDLL